jgi:hypothetical protein
MWTAILFLYSASAISPLTNETNSALTDTQFTALKSTETAVCEKRGIPSVGAINANFTDKAVPTVKPITTTATTIKLIPAGRVSAVSKIVPG